MADAARAISADDGLRSYFDRLALADRALGEVHDGEGEESGLEQPGRFERSFGRALFDAELDALLESEAETDSDTDPDTDSEAPGTNPIEAEDNVVRLEPRKPARPIAAWFSAAAVLLVGSLAYFGVVPPEPVFQARTAAVTDFAPRPDSPRLNVFCAERIDGNVRFTGSDDAPFGLVTCPSDAEIKLAVVNQKRRFNYAAFFGVHEDGSLLWYAPSPAATEPIAIDATDELQPVGESIRLGVNHGPGAVRVHALFAIEPVDFAALQSWVDAQGPTLFDHAMVVEPAVGETDTQLFEVAEER